MGRRDGRTDVTDSGRVKSGNRRLEAVFFLLVPIDHQTDCRSRRVEAVFFCWYRQIIKLTVAAAGVGSPTIAIPLHPNRLDAGHCINGNDMCIIMISLCASKSKQSPYILGTSYSRMPKACACVGAPLLCMSARSAANHTTGNHWRGRRWQLSHSVAAENNGRLP